MKFSEIEYIQIDFEDIKVKFDELILELQNSKNKEEAIKIRRDAEEKYFGEYSYLNSIKLNMEEIA